MSEKEFWMALEPVEAIPTGSRLQWCRKMLRLRGRANSMLTVNGVHTLASSALVFEEAAAPLASPLLFPIVPSLEK